MATSLGLGGLLTRIRERNASNARSDAELPRHDCETRGNAALDELIHSFAPLVWKVC